MYERFPIIGGKREANINNPRPWTLNRLLVRCIGLQDELASGFRPFGNLGLVLTQRAYGF